ncbi:MAG: serine/threonine-protein kinase [Nannocystaceae bacterium]
MDLFTPSDPSPSADAREPSTDGLGPPFGDRPDDQAFLRAVERVKLVGRVLCGRYRIDEHVGHGGMADVYVATLMPLNKEVAIKVLSPRVDAESYRRFKREAQTLSTVKHPALVQVTDFGITEDGLQFYAMERLLGPTLADAFEYGKHCPLGQALDLTVQVCSALAKLHSLGIVHRDVKFSNILFADAERSRVKLTDMGIARFTTLFHAAQPFELTNGIDRTPTGPVALGTPNWMPPEAGTVKADAAWDVYSLGVVLFRLLTGRHPGSGHQPRSRVTAFAPEVPASLADVIARALADGRERYPDAGEMLADLEREQRRLRRGWWSAQRVAVWCAIAMVLSALVIGVLVGALWFGGPNVSPRPSQLNVQDELGDRATRLVIPEQRARGVRSTAAAPSVDDATTPSGHEIGDRAAATPPEDLLPVAHPRKEKPPAGSAKQPRLQVPPGLKSRAASCLRSDDLDALPRSVILELSVKDGRARLVAVEAAVGTPDVNACLERIARDLDITSRGAPRRFEVRA